MNKTIKGGYEITTLPSGAVIKTIVPANDGLIKIQDAIQNPTLEDKMDYIILKMKGVI